jgi:predicted Zn-dependent peptidase
VGDFQAAEAAALAERYFGRIPRGTNAIPEVVTWEPKQQAEKRMYAEAEANPQVDVLWHTVPFGHKDSYPLEVLAQLLSGRTGRLYKGLVLSNEVATSTYANSENRRWAGLFNIGGEARDGRTPADVEQAIYRELERLQQEEVPAEELQKVKNQFAAGEYRKLSSNFAILYQLLFNGGFGDWREINAAGQKIQAVAAADVQRVAREYFTRENRTVATYTRKPSSASADEDPDLALLTPEQRPMIRQMMASLKAESDVAKLRQAQAQMQAQADGGDPRRQTMARLMLKKVGERIAELEKP